MKLVNLFCVFLVNYTLDQFVISALKQEIKYFVLKDRENKVCYAFNDMIWFDDINFTGVVDHTKL